MVLKKHAGLFVGGLIVLAACSPSDSPSTISQTTSAATTPPTQPVTTSAPAAFPATPTAVPAITAAPVALPATLTQAMVAIHLDPTGPSVTHATAQNWERLTDLMATADSFGHKLTLLMSSDWADLVAANPVRQTALQDWVNNGHQLGFHHHTCGHASPDGYRDIKNQCRGAEPRGSVADAFAQVQDLATDLGLPSIGIAAQGPNTDGLYRAAEWQPGVALATGIMADNTDGHREHRFITQPRCATDYGNAYAEQPTQYSVAELGHAQLNVGAFTHLQADNNLAAVTQEISQVAVGDHAHDAVNLGLVFHAREYAATPRNEPSDNYRTDRAYLDAVLQLLDEQNVSVVTAQEILEASNPCG